MGISSLSLGVENMEGLGPLGTLVANRFIMRVTIASSWPRSEEIRENDCSRHVKGQT